MDHIPLVSLVFQSIPEALIIVSLGLSLFGVEIKARLKRICLVAVIFALITYILRPVIDSFQLRLFFHIISLVLLVKTFIGVKWAIAFLSIITGLLSLMTIESIVVPLILRLTGISFELVLKNVFLRTFLPWPHLALLMLITLVIAKKGFSLVDIYRSTGKKSMKSKLTLAIILSILVEAFIIATINLTLLIKGDDFTQVISGHRVGFLSLILIISLGLSYFLIRKLFLVTQQEAIISTQETYLENINSLLTAIRAQRHDFLNHVQVIYALAYEGNLQEITNYLKQLTGEIKEINSYIQVNNPAIGALLKTKLAIAEAKNINLNFNLETSLDNLPMKSFELVKILGNLIDNAFDAVSENQQEPTVEVTIKKLLNIWVFEIKNSGPVIPNEQLVKIFERGFTTKQGNHAGLGLAIVQDLVAKYRGEIKVESDENRGTAFIVIIPAECGALMSLQGITDNLAHIIVRHADKKYSPAVISYGLEIILGELIKDIIILILAWQLDMFSQVLAAVVCFASLRLVTGGAHCTSYLRCLVTTIACFIGVGSITQWGYQYFSLPVFTTLYIFALLFSGYVIIRWVPGNSENKVIDDPVERNKFKKLSFLVVAFWLLALLIFYANTTLTGLSMAVLLAMIMQMFFVTGMGTKVMTFIDLILQKLLT